MEETEFIKIIELITQKTGIIPLESHKLGIKNYINSQINKLKEEKITSSYYDYLLSDNSEMINLINSATVNETYFFREEMQFSLLRSKIIPELTSRKNGPLKIWSAASSSGEEIYSLLLLANAHNVQTECIASDINTRVLDIAKEGSYKKKSIRSVDGATFHFLLDPYKTDDGYTFSNEIINQINFKSINLSKLQDFPCEQDIVFMRNVFIYFSSETKKAILNKIADEVLAPGGYFFVSINEVASIDGTILPPNLEKVVDGKVFYFHKKTGGSNEQ